MPEILFFTLYVTVLILGLIYAAICSESYDPPAGKLFILVMLFIGLNVWLITSAATDYKITGEKTFVLHTEKIEGVPHQFIDGTGGKVSIEQTFGQTFFDGTVVKETRINRLCAGIYWNLSPKYLYEVVEYAEYKPVLPPQLPTGIKVPSVPEMIEGSIK